jgi:hypothetical protein
MWRLIRAIVALSLLLIFALVAVIGITYRDRASNISFLFLQSDNTRCRLPCLFGIEPGKTTFEEAYQILEANQKLQTEYEPNIPPNLNEWSSLHYSSLPDSSMALYLVADHDREIDRDGSRLIDALWISMLNDTPTLGELILWLGRPHSVFVRKVDRNYYADVHFVVGEYVYSTSFEAIWNQTHFVPSMRSNGLLLARPARIEAFEYMQIPWLGFASFERYLAEYKKLHPR